ncbi:large extracellular protein with a signal peptide [Cryptosporidium ryanae]|uniref:large extracellular protein with a signal peptide n=1 Tax=Cryptosporidium ryanae TaxID=515981 RepID=UPI00351A38E1|nr:large extracellular protein with a signal peptide [Cryptosporidium ryanae]
MIYKREKLINLIYCGFLLFYFELFVFCEKELKDRKDEIKVKDDKINGNWINFPGTTPLIIKEKIPFVGVSDFCMGNECNIDNNNNNINNLLGENIIKMDNNNYKITRYICILLSDNIKSREMDANLFFDRLNDYVETSELPISFVEFYEKLGVFIIDIKSIGKEQDDWNLLPLIEGLRQIKKLDILNKADCTRDSIMTEQSVFKSNGNIIDRKITSSINFNNTFGINRSLLSSDIQNSKNDSQIVDETQYPKLYKELDGYFLKKFSEATNLIGKFKSITSNNESSSVLNTINFLSSIGGNSKEKKRLNNIYEKNNSKITISPLYLMSLNNKNKNITEITQNIKNQVSPIDKIDMSKEDISLDKDLVDNIATAIFKGMSDSSSLFPPPFGNPSRGSTLNNSYQNSMYYNINNSPVISSLSYKPIPQGNSNYMNGFSSNERIFQTGTDSKTGGLGSNYNQNINIANSINVNNLQNYDNSIIGFNNQNSNINNINNQNSGISQSKSGSGLAPVIFESLDNWGKPTTQQSNSINTNLLQGAKQSNELKLPTLNSPTTSEWMRKAITKQNEGAANKQSFININDITVDSNSNSYDRNGNYNLNDQSGQTNSDLNNNVKPLFSNNKNDYYFNTPLTQASKLSNTPYGYFNPQNYGHSQGTTFIKMNGSVFDDPNDITSFRPEEFIHRLPDEVSNNMTQSQKDKINLINAFIGTGFDTVLQMNNFVSSGNNDQYKTSTKRRLFELNSYNETLENKNNNSIKGIYENLLSNIDTNQGQDTAMAYVTGCDCKRFPDGIACPLVLSGEINIQCIGYKVWDSLKKGAPLSDVASAIDSAINSNAKNIVLPLKFDLKTIEENRSAPRILRQIMRRTSKENNILFALPTGNNGSQEVNRSLDFPCDDLSGIYAFCVGSINNKSGLLSSFTNVPQLINAIYVNGEDVESIGINQQKQLFSGTGIALAQSIGALNIIQGITKEKTTIFDQLAILYSSPKKLPSKSFLEQIFNNSNPYSVYNNKISDGREYDDVQVLDDKNDTLMHGMKSDNNEYERITIAKNETIDNNKTINAYMDEIRSFLHGSSILNDSINIGKGNNNINETVFDTVSAIKNNYTSAKGLDNVNATTTNIKDNKSYYNNTHDNTTTSTSTKFINITTNSDNTSTNFTNKTITSSNINTTVGNETILITGEEKNNYIKQSKDQYDNEFEYYQENKVRNTYDNDSEEEKTRNLYRESGYTPEILGVVLEPKEITEMSRLVQKSNEYYMNEFDYNEYGIPNTLDISNNEESIPKMMCYEEETRFYSPLEMAIPVENIEQCILSCSNTPDCKYYSYGAFLKGPRSIVGTCILMPDKQGSVSLPNFQSGSLGCPVSASVAYAEAMEERLMSGVSTVQENSKQKNTSSNINNHLNSDWPGILSTSSVAVKSMSGFLSRFPLNDILQTSISLYNSGFLDQKGALRPSGAFEKQSVLPPPGVGSPHVVCTLQGMQCCVPQKSAKGWRKKPPSFLRVDHPSCEAIYVSKTDMFCATTSLYDNEGITNLEYGSNNKYYDHQKGITSGNCGMVIIETSEHLIFQNTLKMPSREMNNALCECKLNKRDNSIHGSGTWEYSVQAVQAAMNKKVEGDQLSTGVAQALAWVEAVGNDPNPAVNGLGELISQVAQRPNSDVELITQIPAISQNAVSNMLYNQQKQQNANLQGNGYYDYNNQDNFRSLMNSLSNCITSWPDKCQVWKSKCEDNLIYGYKNPQCIPVNILENGCPMKQVGFRINHIDSGILSFGFRPMKFSDDSPFRIACQFSLVKCSVANVMHHCSKKRLDNIKQNKHLNHNVNQKGTITGNGGSINIRKHYQIGNKNIIDTVIENIGNSNNNIPLNYLPYWPKENNTDNNDEHIIEKYIRVRFPQAGNYSSVNMIQLFNNKTKRDFAAKIISEDELPKNQTVENVDIYDNSDFQYLGKVEVVPNGEYIKEGKERIGHLLSNKNTNTSSYSGKNINIFSKKNNTSIQSGRNNLEKYNNINNSDHNYFYGQEDELGLGYNFNYNYINDYDDNSDYNKEPLLLDKYQPDITGNYYPEFKMEQIIIENKRDNESNGDFYSYVTSKAGSGWEIKLDKKLSSSSLSYFNSGIKSYKLNSYKYMFTTTTIFFVLMLM